jgi:hypothetical protein
MTVVHIALTEKSENMNQLQITGGYRVEGRVLIPLVAVLIFILSSALSKKSK